MLGKKSVKVAPDRGFGAVIYGIEAHIGKFSPGRDFEVSIS